MNVIVAIDSFKGCLSSPEANRAAAMGVRDVFPEAEIQEIAVSDGGEGFTEAMAAGLAEVRHAKRSYAAKRSKEYGTTERRTIIVHDPLMRPVEAHYLLAGETAVMEVAEACGLSLLQPEERNPLIATSYGVGEMVIDAIRQGAKHIIVGLGGSGTSDAGRGMIEAIEGLKEFKGFETFKDVCFTIATDVDNPLCGENGAAHVYGPQKGATPEMVVLLDSEARSFADVTAKEMGFDLSEAPGAGAAGGLGYAFMQFLHATRRSGVDVLFEALRFSQLAAAADLVITGEGAADRQTLMGKLPTGVLRHSGSTPVLLIAGRISDRDELLQAGFAEVRCINPPGLALEEAMRPEVAVENIRKTVGGMVQELRVKS